MRALALAAFAAAPFGAQAAGLGLLSVQSSLGQPLRVEIEITSVLPREESSLVARLASPEVFARAGIDRGSRARGSSFSLDDLQFSIERPAKSNPILRIVSRQPVEKPFVDLVVELSWATGRFVREYTFLLDPPELGNPRLVVEGGKVQEDSQFPPAGDAGRRRAEPAARAVPAERAPARAAGLPSGAAPAAQAASASGVVVRPGETLSEIARRAKSPDVQLAQALVAIYRANPAAFYGTIHQLRSGATLEVPGPDAMASVEPRAAAAEIAEQNRRFAEHRARIAQAPASVPAGVAGTSAQGEVTARPQPRADERAAGDRLRLSKGAPEGAGAAAPGATKSATEGQVARDAALREQQTRVAELEKNVADLQRLLELKNRQLSEAEKRVEEARAAAKTTTGTVQPPAPAAAPPAGAAKAPATAPAPSDTTAPAPVPAPAAPPVAATAPVAPSAATPPAPAAPAPAAATPAAPAAPAPVATSPATTPSSAAPAAPPAAAKAPKAVPAPVPAEESVLSAVGDVLSDPAAIAGLGAIVAIVAGYGWYSVRRRRKADNFDDSLIDTDGFATNSLFGSTGGESVDTESSVFPTPAPEQPAGEPHATEVDPIAEAEVYIAYGREAQAEEILREGLNKHPDRQAIRAKLLELLFGRRDATQYNALAAEMFEMTGGRNEEWAKVAAQGQLLDPRNPLYEPDESVFHEDIGVADEPYGAEPAPTPAPAQAQAQPTGGGSPALDTLAALDIDLDLDTTIGKSGAPSTQFRTDLERAINGRFDLPSLDIPTLGSGKAGETRDDAGERLDRTRESLAAAAAGDASAWHEAATKLDLAGAYEEIGDREGARELLEEVLRAGDDEQRRKAQAMLDRIGEAGAQGSPRP